MASPFLLAQQVFTALTNKPNTCPDTRVINGTISQIQAQPGPSFPTDILSLITFLLSFSALGDWFKLIVLGGVLETCRRLAFHFYHRLYNSFFITATFEDDDSSYGTRINVPLISHAVLISS
jgi:mitochondrial chaperone BCS1